MEKVKVKKQTTTSKTKRSKKEERTKSKMISGYILYASEIRKEIVAAYKDKDFGEISKMVGEAWRNLAQEEKVVFEKRAEEQNEYFKIKFANEAKASANRAAAAAAVAAAVAAAAGDVAPDLDKLADVASERAANEETQHQQQQQQQMQLQQQNKSDGQSFVSTIGTNQDSSYMSNQSQSFMSPSTGLHEQQQQSQLRSPLPPAMGQYANNSAINYSASYNQQTAYYSQLMGQSTPILMRPPTYNGTAIPNDILLQQQQAQLQGQAQNVSGAVIAAAAAANQQIQQQQQPFSIVPHPQSQPTTTVQYCNNPACCASGRYQPYPLYSYSPPEPPITPTTLQQQQQQQPQQQQQQRVQSPVKLSSPTHQAIIAQQQHLYKMNNIIYKKPSQVKLKPKDAETQTDPIVWANDVIKKGEGSPKKQELKFSKEFIQHISSLGGNVGAGENTDEADNK